MEKTVVTSFGAHEYGLYARNFLETFDRHWPKDIKLAAFVETDTPPCYDVIENREFIVEPVGNVDGLSEFIAAISYFPVACGSTPRGYSIFNDARSGRATFMHAHAVKRFNGGKVFWLDADIVTHADVTHDFLDDCLPDDTFCCYLGRRDAFSENGFIGFNATHKIAGDFMGVYRSIYTSGVVFLEPGWNDCSVFDRARRMTAGHSHHFKDLGAGVQYTPQAQHVFINSRLGAVMDHLKGGRKALGKSPISDLASPRSEPYWQPETVVGVQTR